MTSVNVASSEFARFSISKVGKRKLNYIGMSRARMSFEILTKIKREMSTSPLSYSGIMRLEYYFIHILNRLVS